jgi:hypothetical protein
MKVAAASNLSKEEFTSMFYSNDYESCKGDVLYYKFRDSMSFRSQIFWDTVLFYNSWAQVYSSKLFANPKRNYDKNNYPFLIDEGFDKLKENGRKIKINSFTSDLSELENHVKDKSYDLIFLSNIDDYMKIDNYYKYIKNLKINPNGIMLSTFHIDKGINKYNDYQLLKNKGFKEKNTDMDCKLLIKKY